MKRGLVALKRHANDDDCYYAKDQLRNLLLEKDFMKARIDGLAAQLSLR